MYMEVGHRLCMSACHLLLRVEVDFDELPGLQQKLDVSASLARSKHVPVKHAVLPFPTRVIVLSSCSSVLLVAILHNQGHSRS